MATLIRRTLRFTSAPIFNSLSMIVPQLARANLVPAKPIRRSAHSSTYASATNHSQIWLARMVAAEVR